MITFHVTEIRFPFSFFIIQFTYTYHNNYTILQERKKITKASDKNLEHKIINRIYYIHINKHII